MTSPSPEGNYDSVSVIVVYKDRRRMYDIRATVGGVEDTSLLTYFAMSPDKQLQTFQGIMMASS
jgi:hypothetical protein